MRRRACSRVSPTGYRTVFAHAEEVWRRCVINKESMTRVAFALGREHSEITAFVHLLRAWGEVPPVQRLAVAAMLVPDVTDQDIAWAFGRSVDWAKTVRKRRAEIRAAWPVELALEYVEMDPTDPTPAEIREMCATMAHFYHGAPRNQAPGIRNYRMDSRASLVPQLAK